MGFGSRSPRVTSHSTVGVGGTVLSATLLVSTKPILRAWCFFLYAFRACARAGAKGRERERFGRERQDGAADT